MNLYQRFKKDFTDQKILIFGLGLQGKGVKDTAFFSELGAKVRVTDLKSKEELSSSLEKLKDFNIQKYTLGKHLEEDVLWADALIRNPDVPDHSPYLQLAKENNIPVFMDESLFLSYFGTQKVIGITGTRGKTTTTRLVHQLLEQANYSVTLAGNIPGKACLPLLKNIPKNQWLVLELSSWQLQGFADQKLSPHIGVITTIYQDHQDRYSSMEEYVQDKKNIGLYQNENDFLVLNKDFYQLRKLEEEVESQVVWFNKHKLPNSWQLNLPGKHNRENAAAALTVGNLLRIDKEIAKQVFENFAGVDFRLQEVAQIDGVKFINDTTSTTPAAGIAALNSFEQPIHLLAGGADKQLDLKNFAREIAKQAKQVYLLSGSATPKLRCLLRKLADREQIAGEFNDFKKAIHKAKEQAEPGEVVLLSPGCASFGMFKNEFDRGKQFNQFIKQLQKNEKN